MTTAREGATAEDECFCECFLVIGFKLTTKCNRLHIDKLLVFNLLTHFCENSAKTQVFINVNFIKLRNDTFSCKMCIFQTIY